MINVGVRLLHDMRFCGEDEEGHTITMDSTYEFGGANTGPDPMSLLLMALGGCTGMDVISILRKKRQDVSHYEVQVSGERAEEHPKIYTKVKVQHIVKGNNISRQAVERAVELSTEKYCSVLATVRKTVEVEIEIAVEEA